MNSIRYKTLACLAGALSLTTGAQPLLALSFTPTYTGGDAQTQNATTAALNALAAYFGNSVALPVQVTIGDLGNTGTLGSSSVSSWEQLGGSGVFYPSPLRNVLNSTTPIAITISMNINASVSWEYGATTPTGGKYSWQSVVMHEALHSMGFYDGVADASGALAQAGYTIFDSFTTIGPNGSSFMSLGDNTARQAAITSNNLYWGGTNGKQANGGNPVKLYSPGTFESGSTYSHIDPSLTGAGGLLFPTLGADTFFAGPTSVELGIMKDLGWTVVPEPATYAWAFGGLCMGFFAWQRRKTASSVAA